MKPLLILGASARSAAESALRAGFAPRAADLFADLDLAVAAPATRVEAYPQGLAAAADTTPPGPWMYTGALENELELIDRLAAKRPLWGNSGESVMRARDPLQVEELLRASGLHTPETRLRSPAPDDPRAWLIKPRRSAGGRKIRFWTGPFSQAESPSRADAYFQAHVEGTACSSVFVVGPRSATLVGSCEQLIGDAWCGARDFQFAGALGPLELAPRVTEQLTRLGQRLWCDFRLRGLVGVDWILRGDEAWIIEINPRYTASVEVLERSLGLHLIHWHAQACAENAELASLAGVTNGYSGKAILYAEHDVVFPATLAPVALASHARWNSTAGVPRNDQRTPWGLADIPAGGTRLRRAAPVLTILAQAPDRQQVFDTLQSLMDWVRQCLERQDAVAPPRLGTSCREST